MSMGVGIPAPRPTSVTVAIAVGWIAVVLDLVGGIALVLLANDENVTSALGVEGTTARTWGIVSIVIAVVLALVVYLLGKGSNVARMLVTIVMLLRIGFGAYVLVVFGSHQFAEAVVTIALAVTAIALLWNSKASDFFATNNP